MKILKKIQPRTNTIYRGDNLSIMRAMPDECVDLVYIDPPFFTQKNYKNIWGDRESAFDYGDHPIAFQDTKDYFERHVSNGAKGLDAYLTWMRSRLVEIHRLMSPTGSFYCHLDYHAVHYVKVILDEIFGYRNFRSEIIWKRKQGSNSAEDDPRSLSTSTDTILYYTKSNEYVFNQQYQPYSAEYVAKNFRLVDDSGEKYSSTDLSSPSYRENLVYTYKGYQPPKTGWKVKKEEMEKLDKQGLLIFPRAKTGRIRRKKYLKDSPGIPITNLWNDIGCLQKNSPEKTGWPTQKPLALLERIINSSSTETDLVFDCFAGCGTAMHAAHILKRKWIGTDISPKAIEVNLERLQGLGAKVGVVDEDELEVSHSKRAG